MKIVGRFINNAYRSILFFMILVNGLFLFVSVTKLLLSHYPGSLSYVSVPVSAINIVFFMREFFRSK